MVYCSVMSNELLTVEEVASFLKVDAETVRRWLLSGELKGTKIGKKLWRITVDEFEKFLKKESKDVKT